MNDLLNRRMRLFLQQFAEDGNGAGGETPPGADSGTDGAGSDAGNAGDQSDLASQLEQTKAELARMKAAFDKAAHESSERKKELDEAQKTLKAKMTAEEIAAQEKKEADDDAAVPFSAPVDNDANAASGTGVDEESIIDIFNIFKNK